jgi:hypothetical protein
MVTFSWQVCELTGVTSTRRRRAAHLKMQLILNQLASLEAVAQPSEGAPITSAESKKFCYLIRKPAIWFSGDTQASVGSPRGSTDTCAKTVARSKVSCEERSG